MSECESVLVDTNLNGELVPQDTASNDDEILNAPTPNPQAQAMFGEHQKEIKRRSEMLTSDALNPASFTRSKEGSTDLPFHILGQEWVLFSVSHVRMPPICEDSRKPAIRFYGMFESAEDASDHARVVLKMDSSVNMQLCRAHEWVAMGSSPERLGADHDMRAHVTSVLDAYTAQRSQASSEFEENVTQRKGGGGKTEEAQVPGLPDEPTEHAATTANCESVSNGLQRATRLPRGGDVRGQSFLVVSFISDNVQTIPEPIFRVYAAFDTQSEADVYVRNTAGECVQDVDIFVTSACEWLFPQNIDDNRLANEVYRSSELDSVMSNHKAQPQKVESFTKWRDSGETTPAVHER